MVNAIYLARDRGDRPRAHDDGLRLRVLRAGEGSMPRSQIPEPGDAKSLVLIQGPLALDWRRRKAGVLPRLENGELTAVHPPDRARARQGGGVLLTTSGRPNGVR